MLRRLSPLFWVLLGSCVMAQKLYAQTAGVDAGSLLQEFKARPMQPNLAPPSKRLTEEPKVSPPPPPGGLSVKLVSVDIEGDLHAFSKEELLAVVADEIGKTLNLAQLQALAERLTKFYHDHGFMMSRAVLPAQDVTEGHVRIVVLEGSADSREPVRIRGDGLRLNRSFAADVMKQALGSGPLTELALERGSLLLSDIPGVSATSSLEPGDEPGSVRVVINAAEDKITSGSITLDNTGPRSTGADQLGMNLAISDPLGLGDQTSLNLKTSPDGGEAFGALGYSLPLGDSGLRLIANASHLQYRAIGSLAAAQATGSADEQSLNLRYPLIRSRLDNLWLSIGLDNKQLINKASGLETSNRGVQSYVLGINGDRSDPLDGSIFWWSANGTLGQLDLDANANDLASDQGATGARTQGEFLKLSVSAGYSVQLDNYWSLMLTGMGQLANKNLGTSEKIIIGGPFGVRAYPVGEGQGDEGLRLSAETRYSMLRSAMLGEFSLLGLLDWGHIRQYVNPGRIVMTSPNTYDLAGAGLGVMLSKSKAYEFRVTWVHALGSDSGLTASGTNNDGSYRVSRLWANLDVPF